MQTKREIERLVSVFDLPDIRVLGLPEKVSTRVIFLYDKIQNKREFKVLNKTIPENVIGKIRSWLEMNIDVNHIDHSSWPFLTKKNLSKEA